MSVNKANLKTLPAVSAGGVVFRLSGEGALEPGTVEIVLVGQSRSGRWGLPKGTPSAGETLEQAALREVREETGLDARIVEDLGHIEYWFVAQGVRYHKRVHFYSMQATGGDISRHDFEHDVIGWFSFKRAYEIMSYANEKEIVRRAEATLARLP